MKMTFKIILIGGIAVFFAVVAVAVFFPAAVTRPERTVIAHEYTSLEEQGRELFYSNGCNYCHTQYVRIEDTAMGPVSDAGNYVFDNPLILGSERTGPDLSYIGRKRSEGWEIEHLKSPREFSPMSIMASFEFLSDEELNAIAAYLYNLGDRVAAERMIEPPAPYSHLEAPVEEQLVSEASLSSPPGWQLWNESGLQAGKEIFVARCVTCHGDSGNGLGSYAGTLIVTPADFRAEPYRSMKDDEFFWHVSEGIQGSVMPPWKASLSEEERWQVVRYVKTAFADPAMYEPSEGDPPADYATLQNPVDVSIETLEEGKHLFIRECITCHGDAGRGNGRFVGGLTPPPPDFSSSDYTGAGDVGFFWRISEGVPWTAMPTWKLLYSDQDRWKLVNYLQVAFFQNKSAPQTEKGSNFTYPAFYKESMRYPDDVSYERGRALFGAYCMHCHGPAGDGQGWDGQYLNPTPADFRGMSSKQMTPEAQGEHLAKITFGIQSTAMPSWGEVLQLEERWDLVMYIMGSFMGGKQATDSVYSGSVPLRYATLSRSRWVDEGNEISLDSGKGLYGQYCATCHGASGQGDGPGTAGLASGPPAPFPSGMSDNYIYWRTADGVASSMMYGFQPILSDTELWNVVGYTQSLLGSGGSE